MSPFAPTLRPGLAIVRDDQGRPAELVDAPIGQRLHLGAVTGALVERLDGRPWADTVAELGVGQHTPADLERFLRRLLLLGVLGGRADVTTAVSTLPGARFACQGSGACCQNHRLGPLSDEDVARIRGLDPALADGSWYEERSRDGESARYLRAIDHRCTFLGEDQRCGLHARFGAAAKPGFCRLFPFEELVTIFGRRFYDKGACACLATSSAEGALLEEQRADLVSLLPPADRLYHPAVRLDDAVLIDYRYYLRFTDAAITWLAAPRPGGAPADLATLGAALGGLGAALADCPLADGEPDGTLASFLVRGLARFDSRPTENDARDGAEMFTLVLADVIEALDGTGESSGLGPALVAEALALFRLGYRLAARVADPSYPLAPEEERMLAVAAADPDVDAVLRRSLQQQLFGYRSLVADRPRPALARMAILQLAALWGARRSAAERGDCRLRAADLSSGHALAARVLETAATSRVLVQHEDLVPPLLAALPLLAGL